MVQHFINDSRMTVFKAIQQRDDLSIGNLPSFCQQTQILQQLQLIDGSQFIKVIQNII